MLLSISHAPLDLARDPLDLARDRRIGRDHSLIFAIPFPSDRDADLCRQRLRRRDLGAAAAAVKGRPHPAPAPPRRHPCHRHPYQIVFLHAVMARKRKMQLRCRDLEWWMKRRQLPSRLRQRVRQYERQRWAAMRGEDEMEIIKELPEGLRRDIRRHLCLDLVKQVPLFQHLDDLILDNICDRVKHLVYSKDEKVIREGDPVQRMTFIVRGHLKSSQCLSKGPFG